MTLPDEWVYIGSFLLLVEIITLMDQIDWFNDEEDINGIANWIIQNLVTYTATGFQSGFAPEPVTLARTD